MRGLPPPPPPSIGREQNILTAPIPLTYSLTSTPPRWVPTSLYHESGAPLHSCCGHVCAVEYSPPLAKSRGFTSSPGPTHRDPGETCVLSSGVHESREHGIPHLSSHCCFSPTLWTHFGTTQRSLHATHLGLMVLYHVLCS